LPRLATGATAGLLLAVVLVHAAPQPPTAVTITRATRLLVIAPHPDDEALGAGGLIQRVLANGGSVRVLLVTSGDGFAEGVKRERGKRPLTPTVFRNYGRQREHESIAAMAALGVPASHVRFLGFPDQGLCPIAAKYVSTRTRPYQSPYTNRAMPPSDEQVVRGAVYSGSDLRREIERLLVEDRPTLVAIPHSEDDHPDHCSTHLFAREALDAVALSRGLTPDVLHYLVHFGDWPPDGPRKGELLKPPKAFPAQEGRWTSFTLTGREADQKEQAIGRYRSQMEIIGPFLLGFATANELFLQGRPASRPECWCDAELVATDVPVEQRRRRPAPVPSKGGR
jgi:LmbE family N-acetylglucosaminyl deacetylase